MRFTIRTRQVAAVLVCAGAGAAFAAVSGQAQEAGRTITLTEGTLKGAMLDVAPKGVGRGRGSLGDQFFISGPVTADGGARGTLQATFTVGNPRAVRLDRARGVIAGVYHLPDGDVHVQAVATFDDADVDNGSVIGGTGAYAGARGTLESGKSGDVLHLLP